MLQVLRRLNVEHEEGCTHCLFSGNQIKQPSKGHDDKNQLSQCKELWLFWYGEKPDSVKSLVSEDLKEVSDSSGSWESGIPYEVRTLLFKAVNNLIERSLLSREFVRLGKWFVQPFEGAERPGAPKTSHLSFSFQYFVHGESAVCTSVDVRQHPAVRRLEHAHLASAAALSASVQVVLAPYGMAGTLTGVSYAHSDPAARKLLEEWRAFWPLYNNSYAGRDAAGQARDMPACVEVVVGGAKLVYPTSYVLVTDVDPHMMLGPGPGDRTPDQDTAMEPSPFTCSEHELSRAAAAGQHAAGHGARVHCDGVLPEHDFGPAQPDREGGGDPLSHALHSWDLLNPEKTFKKKHRRVKRETKEFKSKSRGGVPMFRKGAALCDPMVWGLDQDGYTSAGSRLAGGHGGHHGAPGGPASVGPMTPRGGPLSVKSEAAMPLLSPHTSGPATPAYTPGGGENVITFNPATPSTPGGPKSVGGAGAGSASIPASPFRAVNPPLPVPQVKTEPGLGAASSASAKESAKPGPGTKRPSLPSKEYEEAADSLSLRSAYDYTSMSAWLSHPVKKARASDGPKSTPVRPMHRRKSQSSIFAAVESDIKAALLSKNATEPPVKSSSAPITNGVADTNNVKPKTEFDENKGLEEENLFSADGLKPSMTDLDNMFEDSDNESGLGCVPTPPNSVKPQIQEDDTFTSSKYSSKKDSHPSSLANDQLHQMFPTPPSHEHPSLHSPLDQDMVDGVKAEPLSPRPELSQQQQLASSPYANSASAFDKLLPGCGPGGGGAAASELSLDSDDYFDHTLMLSSSKFAPLPAALLPSHQLPPLVLPDTFRFKTSYKPGAGPGLAPHPPPAAMSAAGPASLKPGLSPISPAMSDTNPRSNKSTNPPSVGGPRSVGPTTPRVPHTPLGGGPGEAGLANTPAANSLTINLVLSDSILNLYRDINFNSCTMCVCTNEGNIKGGEALMYLPLFAGDDDHNCTCGYSATVNRRLSHLAGMFLEDEREVTSVQEDVYFKKKLSLLLLDPKSQEQGEQRFNERANIVDCVSPKIVELIQQQAGLFTSGYSTVITYSEQYQRHASRQQHNINLVEDMDTTDTIWAALETVRAAATDSGKSDLDQGGKVGCLHRWAVIPAAGPPHSEDIVRVMKVSFEIFLDNFDKYCGI